MDIRVKTFLGEMPNFGTPGSAGADLTANKIVKKGLFKVWYSAGITTEIPKGYVGLLFPRSSISSKVDLTLANSVGVVDSDFRGIYQVRFNYTLKGIFTRKRYKVGDKIAQLIIVKIPEIKYVNAKTNLTKTDRGEKGFGSTDNK